MDHIVRVVTARECIVEVKSVYLQLFLHCFVDSEIELKDANNGRRESACKQNDKVRARF